MDEVLDLWDGEFLPLPHQVEHIGIRAHLKEDENIEFVLKHMVKLDNILMGDTLVDSDLAQQLLLSLTLEQDCFANHLGCVLSFSLGILDQEARSETTCVLKQIPLPKNPFF